MGRTLFHVLRLLPVSALAVACGSAVTYHANGGVPPRAPRDASQIVVQMTGTPRPNAIVIAGELHASGSDTSQSVELLRQEAARQGLDGVTDIVCAPTGSGDSGGCDGKGFVYASQ